VTAGECDINSGTTYRENLLGAVADGDCAMADVDAAVRRTLAVRFELGLFDAKEGQPLTRLGLEAVGDAHSAALNQEAARSSLVLLQVI
jgi:beta-glucosidase-like glycosyl hydrolase